jgi:hypothetical protein
MRRHERHVISCKWYRCFRCPTKLCIAQIKHPSIVSVFSMRISYNWSNSSACKIYSAFRFESYTIPPPARLSGKSTNLVHCVPDGAS